MSEQLTKEQQAVAEHREGSLLVSAAAGSGKTLTLVLHVMHYLTEKDSSGQYGDIRRLVVVTFTNAAAGEMRLRLKKKIGERLGALEDEAAADPAAAAENRELREHLKKQSVLLGLAHISTIDSLCSYLVRNYFEKIDFAPDARIADENEIGLVREDALNAVLERAYASAEPAFLRLLDAFTDEKSDAGIRDAVKRLQGFSENAPDPEAWLKACDEPLPERAEELFCRPAYLRTEALLRQELAEILEEAKCGEALCGEKAADEKAEQAYRTLYRGDADKLEEILAARDFSELRDRIAAAEFPAKPSLRNAGEISDLTKLFRGTRSGNGYLKRFAVLKENYASCSAAEELRRLKMTEEPKRALLRLTADYAAAFAADKKKRGIVTFSDVELAALRLLTEKDENGSPLLDLSGEFDEIIVDEYQDINEIQERLLLALSGESSGRPNLFMVGDVKQSIYGFRQSRPDIFLEKYSRFSESGAHKRIDLSRNFRSRKTVLNIVNSLCSRLMRRELGGLDYDAKAALYFGASYEGDDPEAELWLMQADGSSEDGLALEAAAVADGIRSMIDAGMPVRSENKDEKTRPLRYGDIVILLRALSRDTVKAYADALEKQNIPLAYLKKTGFYETPEIRLLLSVLQIIDNPRQEIPLTAVLTSPLGELSDDELAMLSLTGREGGRRPELYDCLLLQAEQAPERNGKLLRFLDRLTAWRKLADRVSIGELIRSILTESSLELYLLSMPDGRIRMANAEKLCELASDYEKTGYRGIYQFNRYVARQKQLQLETGEASAEAETGNVVRLMTVHASKGCEFPVVILGQTWKKFNEEDRRGDFLFHGKEGIALRSVDTDLRQKLPNLEMLRLRETMQREAYSEELRLLYVAMTRAEEKLILTAFRKCEAGEQLPETASEEDLRRLLQAELPAAGVCAGSAVSAGTLLKGNCWQDWGKAALAAGPVGLKLRCISSVPEGDAEKAGRIEAEAVRRRMAELREKALDPSDAETSAVMEETDRTLRFCYAYNALQGLKGIYPVSALQKLADEKNAAEAGPAQTEAGEGRMRGSVQGGRFSAADRGTVFHKVMEHMPPENADRPEETEAFLKESIRRGLLTAEEAALVSPGDVSAFYASPLGARIRAAAAEGRLRREQPFILGVPSEEIYPGTGREEMLLVQGIIDLCFEEKDGFVLVDYKTDRVTDGSELWRRYGVQLRWYRRALEQNFGLPVKESYIYSFRLGRFIPAPPEP